MKLTLAAAAALIGLAAAFGPAGATPAASLPDGTPVIEAGGRHFGGHRSGPRRGGREFGWRGGRRHFERRGGRRQFERRGGRRGGHRGHGHGHGHGHYQPYVYGGIALGTFLFLDALDHH